MHRILSALLWGGGLNQMTSNFNYSMILYQVAKSI